MKENKEETKLQSEQKTAEEIHPDVAAWNKFKAENKESFRADTVTHDRYLENRLWAAFFAGRDHAASQFKSQLPIEQKAVDNWKDAVNKAATSFVENHKDEAVRSMFGHHFRTFVQGAIWQQEFDSKSSTPYP